MQHLLVVVVLALSLVPRQAVTTDPAQNTLTAAEMAAGWQLLFDGRTLGGWRAYRRDTLPETGWEIRDGSLRTIPKVEGADRGMRVEHWLNGTNVLTYELGSEAVKAGLATSKFKGHSCHHDLRALPSGRRERRRGRAVFAATDGDQLNTRYHGVPVEVDLGNRFLRMASTKPPD